jgi:hypothetical protein
LRSPLNATVSLHSSENLQKEKAAVGEREGERERDIVIYLLQTQCMHESIHEAMIKSELLHLFTPHRGKLPNAIFIIQEG